MSNYFDATVNDSDYWMRFGAGPVCLGVGLNMPQALKSKGNGDDEYVHGLPPYRPRRAYLVDEYPACPENWVRSSGRIKSYFVPVMEDHGLWLDFNTCNHHPNDVAIVVSVQGVNAITGLPCKDATLEQYRDECPKHKKAFGPDRLCKECGFKWPKQNYLASTGTPDGQFWLDGFRTDGGKVRQYVFTEKEMRSVAKAIIGEDRVFALGISYFLSKSARPPRQSITRGYHGMNAVNFMSMSDDIPIGSPGVDTTVVDNSFSPEMEKMWGHNLMDSCSHGGKGMSAGPMGPPGAAGPAGGTITNSCGESTYSASLSHTHPVKKALIGSKGGQNSLGRSNLMKSAAPVATASAGHSRKLMASMPVEKVKVKSMEVAAGARIDQQVFDDPNALDFWQTEPEGIIVINYCSQKEAMAIIRAGKVDVSGSKEGFLEKVAKGNP